jgi:hypothetical protein
MIKVPCTIVLALDINDNIAFLQDFRVAGANHGCIFVCWCEAEEEDSQCLVCMKRATKILALHACERSYFTCAFLLVSMLLWPSSCQLENEKMWVNCGKVLLPDTVLSGRGHAVPSASASPIIAS